MWHNLHAISPESPSLTTFSNFGFLGNIPLPWDIIFVYYIYLFIWYPGKNGSFFNYDLACPQNVQYYFLHGGINKS